MKDIFNRRQRFSLRKYRLGLFSSLGTALFAAGAQSASADEATVAPESAGTAASEAATCCNRVKSIRSTSWLQGIRERASVPKKLTFLEQLLQLQKHQRQRLKNLKELRNQLLQKTRKQKLSLKKKQKLKLKIWRSSKNDSVIRTSKPREEKESSSKPASTTAATTAQPTATHAAAGETQKAPAASEAPAGTTTFSATVSPAAPITGTEAAAQIERQVQMLLRLWQLLMKNVQMQEL